MDIITLKNGDKVHQNVKVVLMQNQESCPMYDSDDDYIDYSGLEEFWGGIVTVSQVDDSDNTFKILECETDERFPIEAIKGTKRLGVSTSATPSNTQKSVNIPSSVRTNTPTETLDEQGTTAVVITYRRRKYVPHGETF